MHKGKRTRHWGVALTVAAVSVAGAGLSGLRAEIVVSGNTFLDAHGELDGTDNWVVIRTDQILQGMIDSFVPGTASSASCGRETVP